ncbi:universal stress protein [Agrobacterium rosae]|uniref:Universal stress protein n=1 Tax=Agrobacterium rosae TaxID=1972867 RepID=A0AAW9FIN0_9HYPH|nr:universal stress protein [Agrobacterium rosae]MDX8304407.1 universal stress protein [Agrobacterium rosae]
MFKHILIPTDGSELAEKGLDQGLLLAKTLGAAATVIVVTVPLSGFALQGMTEAAALGAYDNSVAEELAALKRNIADKAAKAGIAFDFVNVIDASPASAILEVATEKECDLIVISSHGRRGIRRLMLGSQTAEVLGGSTIPVLVVK